MDAMPSLRAFVEQQQEIERLRTEVGQLKKALQEAQRLRNVAAARCEQYEGRDPRRAS